MNEIPLTLKYAVFVLRGSADLTALIGANKVFTARAPEKTLLPYVLVHHESGNDLGRVGAGLPRLMAKPVLVIKGVADADSFATLDAIAREIDQAFEGVVATFAHGGEDFQIGSHRENPISMVETEAGRDFYHLGGRYRFLVSQIGV